MRSHWPVSPLGEHNDFDPPIDAEPYPEPSAVEVAIDYHRDRCATCDEPITDGRMPPCMATHLRTTRDAVVRTLRQHERACRVCSFAGLRECAARAPLAAIAHEFLTLTCIDG